MKQTLYHYTDLNALLGIIQNKKLWLTGAYNLNDHQEIKWALSKIYEKLVEYNERCSDNRAELCWQLIELSVGVPYICSLSEAPDLLSQWRAYASNGDGVSIGLKKEALPASNRLPINSIIPKDSLSLHKVIYQETTQNEIIDNLLGKLFQFKELNSEAHTQMSLIASNLSGIVSLFKNEAFYEEQEWRIIHRPFITGNHEITSSRVNQSISEPRYRISNGKRLVTYFEYDFWGAKPEDIFSEIILGPRSEVSDYDLSILLGENGLDLIPIKRSKASYR